MRFVLAISLAQEFFSVADNPVNMSGPIAALRSLERHLRFFVGEVVTRRFIRVVNPSSDLVLDEVTV